MSKGDCITINKEINNRLLLKAEKRNRKLIKKQKKENKNRIKQLRIGGVIVRRVRWFVKTARILKFVISNIGQYKLAGTIKSKTNAL
ncbi:hypothetical protein G1L02_12570 [Tenacibaculum finnmarkense]|uniref:hypothetical protein n=1 Tax=Tenacibaculum finnmarkense TaxID=2781243 RepID=UPI001EFA3C76|nr:hypothetical protein [Tenacibaculum finnmarkense]MCG8883986.1 hypothetical protein [Tenacibaculum finnmarkense]